MGITITLLILHILCVILYAIVAILSTEKSLKIVYVICSILWGLSTIIDIAKLVIMV